MSLCCLILRRSPYLLALFLATVFFFRAAAQGWTYQAPAETPGPGNSHILLTDCKKCHYKVVRAITHGGMAHKTKITCLDCHDGHPPDKWDVIPKCDKCHQGRSHFELPKCLQCHRDPHQPLAIVLERNITEECLTCHEEPGKELKAFPSIHSRLACTACHTYHGQRPSCHSCHKAHSSEKIPDDCKGCHQPHKPLAVTYGPDTASENCAGCHQAVADQLTSSPAKHRSVACALCHKARHKMIPACQDCHGHPHSEHIHEQFPQCGICHGIAHNLRGYKSL